VTKRHGKSTDLDAALEGLLGKLDRRNAGAWTAAKVAVLWEEVAGPIVDMAALSERYRAEMNLGLGKELISRVQFTVSRKVGEERQREALEQETEEFYKEDDVESVPLTSTERAQVEASVLAISDDELREAVLRATVKDLEWKKGIASRRSREQPPEGV
jgi:hypothetical protein